MINYYVEFQHVCLNLQSPMLTSKMSYGVCLLSCEKTLFELRGLHKNICYRECHRKDV